MIDDQQLHTYLNEDVIEELVPVHLDFITPQGTLLPDWAIQFNQLSEDAMYHQLRFIIHELMIMDIAEPQRLNLMYDISKIGQVLISKLHVSYWNQTGLLNQEQQNALDKVLSIYYSMIIFYHSVWQRLSSKIEATENQKNQSGLAFLKRFNKPATNTPTDIIKRCIFSMLLLLKQSLLEKQIGYRQDTQVLWQYINACYNFARNYQWLSYSFDLNTLLNYQGKLTIGQIYLQCLLADMLQPYAYRRHDLLTIHKELIEWGDYLEVSNDAVTKPYLYVDLHSHQGATLHNTDSKYNPFAATSNALFINLQPILNKLKQLIEQPANTSRHEQTRLAKLVYSNLESNLRPAIAYSDSNEPCHIVVGFHQIHFILAGKTSLDNLIHSHQLPERLRPTINTAQNFEKPAPATINGQYQQYRKLYFPYRYVANQSGHGSRTPTISAINHYQVNSLIAIYSDADQGNKSWQVGTISLLKQHSLDQTVISAGSNSDEVKHQVGVELQVALLGKGIVPCGVRLLYPDTRLPVFMPALIIPKSETLGHPVTSLMLPRFGYKVGDKIIIRIDNKEVQARLTELLDMTDDTEAYNFIRIT